MVDSGVDVDGCSMWDNIVASLYETLIRLN